MLQAQRDAEGGKKRLGSMESNLGTRVRTQWANDVPFGRPDPIEKDHACQPPDHDIVCTHSASATDYQQDPLGQISLPSNPVFIGVFLLGFDFSSSYLVPE